MARPVLGGSHAVGVVLAQVDDGQVPEAGDVGSLEELTLVRRSIAVHSDSEVLLAPVLLGEGESGADGQLGADDTISTVIVALPIIVVHGASLSR